MSRALAVVLTLALLAAPLAVGAQPTGKVPRIGWLGGPTRETAQAFVQPFLQLLRVDQVID